MGFEHFLESGTALRGHPPSPPHDDATTAFSKKQTLANHCGESKPSRADPGQGHGRRGEPEDVHQADGPHRGRAGQTVVTVPMGHRGRHPRLLVGQGAPSPHGLLSTVDELAGIHALRPMRMPR